MANLNLVIDTSNFKPFDFSNALSVLRDIRDANYRTDELISKIQEELGRYILPEGSKYRELLDAFWKDFTDASDNFYNNSNLNTMNAIRAMRSRYNKEIVPLRTLVENYNKVQEALSKASPDTIIANRDDLSNLDTYYGGMMPQIRTLSATNIQRLAAAVTAGMDNALRGNPEVAGKIAEQYFIIRQSGLDTQEALDTLFNNHPLLQSYADSVNPYLKALDKLYQANKFEGGAKENDLIWDNIVLGSIAGFQAPTYNMQNNLEYMSPYQRESIAGMLLLRRINKVDELRAGYIDDKYDPTAAAARLKELLEAGLGPTSTKPTTMTNPPDGALPFDTDKGRFAVKEGEDEEIPEVYEYNAATGKWEMLDLNDSRRSTIERAYNKLINPEATSVSDAALIMKDRIEDILRGAESIISAESPTPITPQGLRRTQSNRGYVDTTTGLLD